LIFVNVFSHPLMHAAVGLYLQLGQ